MGSTGELILRFAIIIGLTLFFWSVSSSLEQIAKALTRLADGRAGSGPRPGGDVPPTPPAV